MDDLRSAMEDHMDQMADLVQKLSAELRTGLRPAYDNFIGFFHAIDWKEPWLMGLLGFHFLLLLTTITSRKNLNFQMILFLLSYISVILYLLYSDLNPVEDTMPPRSLSLKGLPFPCLAALGGVFLAERLNSFLGKNWKSFAGQNYFDPNGVFLSVLWSGPLLIIAIIILINTLFSLCHLIVRWKRAELRHRATLARNKQE
ncbi:hypothetical protein G4B88_021881 [Cannabis sativa]|uniref:Transmembrane protein 18 n=1 Tax=Cannabis sativa TaxID=3483 RepID=A0A7J6GZB2_CANSA|nr:hypothetical protein G4B88_021881 [Cannabis sativa]